MTPHYYLLILFSKFRGSEQRKPHLSTWSLKRDRARESLCKTTVSGWSLIFAISNFFPSRPRKLIFRYVVALGHDILKLENLRNPPLETTAMSPRSLERSEINMRWVFCINFRGLYLASEDTSRDAVFAALIYGRGRTKRSNKNRGSIIRVTSPLKLY